SEESTQPGPSQVSGGHGLQLILSNDLAEPLIMTPESTAHPLDRHFAALMQRLSGNSPPELELAASLVSRAQFEGNVCFGLAPVAAETKSTMDELVRKLKSAKV